MVDITRERGREDDRDIEIWLAGGPGKASGAEEQRLPALERSFENRSLFGSAITQLPGTSGAPTSSRSQPRPIARRLSASLSATSRPQHARNYRRQHLEGPEMSQHSIRGRGTGDTHEETV